VRKTKECVPQTKGGAFCERRQPVNPPLVPSLCRAAKRRTITCTRVPQVANSSEYRKYPRQTSEYKRKYERHIEHMASPLRGAKFVGLVAPPNLDRAKVLEGV